MEWVKKLAIAVLAVYALMFVLSFFMWPVRNVWYGFIDYQTELFVGLLVFGVAGVIVAGGGGGHHK